MKTYDFALIPCDGISKEVIPVSIKALDKAAALSGCKLTHKLQLELRRMQQNQKNNA